MKQLYLKESAPIIYDDDGLRLLRYLNMPKDMMLFNMHWHDRMELILVLEGELHIRIRNHDLTLTANQLAIIPPGCPHHGSSGKSGLSFETIMFEVGAFYNGLPITDHILKPIENQKIAFATFTEHPEIISLVKDILDASVTGDSFTPFTNIGRVYRLIGLLCRYCTVEELEPMTNNKFQHILDYINQHFAENISSVTLSNQFGYSEAYFCRQFKAVTGLKPMVYIRILRLEVARELLAEKRYSLTEVATRCGFSNASYFTSCFRSHFGMTPTDYIKERTPVYVEYK